MLITRNRSIDWDQLCLDARNGGLGLPAHVTFRYLAKELQALIPVSATSQLEESASQVSLALRETALFGLFAGRQVSVMETVRNVRTVGDVLALAKWMLLPSPNHMRWKYVVTRRWLLPVYYLLRPLKGLAHRVRDAWSRRPSLAAKDEPS